MENPNLHAELLRQLTTYLAGNGDFMELNSAVTDIVWLPLGIPESPLQSIANEIQLTLFEGADEMVSRATCIRRLEAALDRLQRLPVRIPA